MPQTQTQTQPAPLAGQLAPEAIKDFALAGKAHLTLVSGQTGCRLTYRIEQARDFNEATQTWTAKPLHFVQVLAGPDNTQQFSYLGLIRHGATYEHGKKSKIGADAASAKAFTWFWSRLQADTLPHDKVAVYHDGRCGCCGRLLTVPSSVATGIGPVCAKKHSN